jgi:hypothetical protein
MAKPKGMALGPSSVQELELERLMARELEREMERGQELGNRRTSHHCRQQVQVGRRRTDLLRRDST